MIWLYRKTTVIRPAQTVFKGNFTHVFFTGLTALFISLGAYAQSADKQVERAGVDVVADLARRDSLAEAKIAAAQAEIKEAEQKIEQANAKAAADAADADL